MSNAITPFSVLSWWQKKKFQWKFRDPEYLHMLKTARGILQLRNEYVCLLLLDRFPNTCSPLCRHISMVQRVDYYDRWMARRDLGAGYVATHWGRKAWVDQMIKALES